MESSGAGTLGIGTTATDYRLVCEGVLRGRSRLRLLLVLVFFALLCAGAIALGQPGDASEPELVWERYDPEPYHQALGIAASGDGGLIVAAYMREAPYGFFDHDIVLLKLDHRGNQIWKKVFEDENTLDPFGSFGCLAEIGEGSIIMAGQSVNEVYLLRIDSEGSIVWRRTYRSGLPVSASPHVLQDMLAGKPCGVVRTGDGGLVVGGRASLPGPDQNETTLWTGLYLFKTDGDGELLWNRTYPGMEPCSMVASGDGGFVVLGTKRVGKGEADLCVVKTDGDGEEAWERTYGHDAWDSASALITSDDGGYLALGETFLVKIDGSGNKVWERPYGGTSMTKANDGGFVVTSRTATCKIDEEGNKVWEKEHYVEGVWPVLADEWDSVAGILGTDDHGFVLAGDAWGDLRVEKIDDGGEEVWDRVYGSRRILVDVASSGDGGSVVAGSKHAEGAGSGSGAYLVKIDVDGNKVWEKDNWGPGLVSTNAIAPSGDGGFVVAGSGLGKGGRDVFILRIDAGGNKIWEETYGTPEQDIAADIVPSGDGGFVVAGYTGSVGRDVQHVYVLKVDAWGQRVWESNYELGQWGVISSIAPAEHGGCILAGSRYAGGVGFDTCLFMIDGGGRLVWEETYGSGTTSWPSIVKSGDGFVVTSPDGPTVMIDGSGDKIWEKTYVDELSGLFVGETGPIGGDCILGMCDGESILQHAGSIVFWQDVVLWRIDGRGEVTVVADLHLPREGSWWDGSGGWLGLQGMALGWNGTFVLAGNIQFPYCREPFVAKFRDPGLVGVECAASAYECQHLFPQLWDKVSDKFSLAKSLIEAARREGTDSYLMDVMELEYRNAEQAQRLCDLGSAQMHLDWIIQAAPEPYTVLVAMLLVLLMLPLHQVWLGQVLASGD